MKKVYNLVAALSLSFLTIGAFAQSSNNILLPTGKHKTSTKTGSHFSPKKANAASMTIVLNYDSADASIYGAANHIGNQGQLFNAHYKYPADTAGGLFDVINAVTVAFDSLVDPYNGDASYTAAGVTIDTLVIPIVHTNHSGKKDTLDIQINSVDKNGYPTSTILKDTMIVNTLIGDTNSTNLISNLLIPEHYTLTTSSKFAVTVKYYGPKADSCYFIYGFPSFSGTCQGAGPFTLADSSYYSKIKTASGGSFIANSILAWANPAYGVLPNKSGANIFYDCNSDNKLDAGDGWSYYQDINVLAEVTFVPTAVQELASKGFDVNQNAPNPFNKTTQITYNLTKSSDVLFNVFDITGRKLISTSYNDATPGQHVINLSANQFTPGVYFYSFDVNGSSITKKMVITQ